jgi:hypothetical protein
VSRPENGRLFSFPQRGASHLNKDIIRAHFRDIRTGEKLNAVREYLAAEYGSKSTATAP